MLLLVTQIIYLNPTERIDYFQFLGSVYSGIIANRLWLSVTWALLKFSAVCRSGVQSGFPLVPPLIVFMSYRNSAPTMSSHSRQQNESPLDHVTEWRA